MSFFRLTQKNRPLQLWNKQAGNDIDSNLTQSFQTWREEHPSHAHIRGYGYPDGRAIGNGDDDTWRVSAERKNIPPLSKASLATPHMEPGKTLPPFFFRDEYARLIVRGNFLTLAAKPVYVDEGEWLAHQVVEQYRLLNLMIQIIAGVDDKTGLPVCNPQGCPTMSASTHTYYWLDNQKQPADLTACQFIQLMEKSIVGKISDPTLFPTGTVPTPYAGESGSSVAGRSWLGKSSGFPENFEADVKHIYQQMMRCYAHLFHGHWVDPFWHVNAYKELNTCFVHFINVGKLFNLIDEKEMEPMQPLIDLWLAKGLLPTARYQHQSGQTDTGNSFPDGSNLKPNILGGVQ